MITYEVTINCDGCKFEHVAGETSFATYLSLISAVTQAEAQGWTLKDNKWFCPNCGQYEKDK